MWAAVLVLVAIAAAAAVVAAALVARSSREGARMADDAARAAASAERAEAALQAIGSSFGQVQASVSALARHATGSSAIDQERFDALSREFARTNAKLDDVRREVQAQLGQNREAVDARLAEVRAAVDRQLGAIRQDNAQQLDRMRATVDEKLQATLENRIARSFKQVSDQLEAVYRGLGDMQGLAAGVGDLKRVLGNVKTRGILGEVQLGSLLADILAPDQYVQNVVTKPGSTERVEFAVRIPMADGEPVLLPIDAKFPGDTYDRLRTAVDAADAAAVAEARHALEQRIKQEARDIEQKYISVPETTNLAILFLPFEGLYAEVVNIPGLLESLQRDYRVSVAGPSTMAAVLNSLQMSYQTFAFQRQADEIQRVLAAVKAELPRYQAALQKAYDQINRAGSTVESIMTTRTRAMERKLRSVTALDDSTEAERVLGVDGERDWEESGLLAPDATVADNGEGDV
ncbi:recombinase RmuC [Collinsella sp. An2]|nr:recombinase RmuC [Collinsella sp. An2]